MILPTKNARNARNTLRRSLWQDDSFAHRWLCHLHDQSKCEDGCDKQPLPERVAFYLSEAEQ